MPTKTTEEYLEELLYLANSSCKNSGLYYFLLGLSIAGVVATYLYIGSLNSYRKEVSRLKSTIDTQTITILQHERQERLNFLRSEGIIKD